jgi:LmbE family N-acetylglucosaminyl deacetylase
MLPPFVMDLRRTVLLSCAHPDDESFMAGGLCCHLSRAGVRVVLSCATLGEEGSAGNPPLYSKAELPAARERELRNAMSILGIEDLELLGYRDKQLHAVDPPEIRSKLVRIIRSHRPQVVLTFDPNGFNGHPDHIAISRFTSDAIAAAADGRWYPEAGPPWIVQRLIWNGVYSVREVGADPDLRRAPGVDFLIATGHCKEAKAEALKAHRTQHVSLERHYFSPEDTEAAFRCEVYRQAWGPPLPQRPVSDLFLSL